MTLRSRFVFSFEYLETIKNRSVYIIKTTKQTNNPMKIDLSCNP